MEQQKLSLDEKRDIQWNRTFEDFKENFEYGTMTHESWFRTQQKQMLDGQLKPERAERLERMLGDSWELANMTALKNTARSNGLENGLKELEQQADSMEL